jgi:hypothetical protein
MAACESAPGCTLPGTRRRYRARSASSACAPNSSRVRFASHSTVPSVARILSRRAMLGSRRSPPSWPARPI